MYRRAASRCIACRSRSMRSNSSSAAGETPEPNPESALEMLRASSSVGSGGKRSSSERYKDGRSDWEAERESRCGHDGNAQDLSWASMLLDVTSRGVPMEMGLMELYEPYEPYMMAIWLLGSRGNLVWLMVYRVMM